METAASAASPTSVLVVDDDPLVANAIATLVEREGRTVIVCNDTASAELALHEFPFTHVISDLQLSKDVSFEGVRFVDAARRAQPASRIIVVSGYASQIVRSAALASGADAFLAKPFDDTEISLALGEGPSDSDAAPGRVLEVRSVDSLIAERAIVSHFQPIVSLASDTPQVHGFEALARIPSGWPFSDMKTLFDYASRKNRVFDINRACIEAGGIL